MQPLRPTAAANPQPSPAIRRWAALVPAGGEVLDVAAGRGRHALLFAERDHPVTAIDRDTTALRGLGASRIAIVEADLEHGPWPLPGRTFAAVVVTNYLWRPLLSTIVASVRPGGVLLYETFAVGNERYGRPQNPEFLLRPGELLDAVRGELRVREYGHGAEGVPPRAMRQRLCAVRPL
ncbi:MAG: class I SAM-dependent methyltransferase [Planctomycetes bacterium]|nr:class I SAM-dependent methyltransferase [Planctomycetota bacterium]